MAKYAAAIDQGTTSTRCMVFDHGGKVVSVAQKEHEQIYPKPGWVEHDAKEIWARTQEVVDEAMESAGASADDIAGVGITNQRETTVVWDKTTGEPVHNAIVWQDTRTDKLVDEFSRDGGQDRFQEQVGPAAGDLLLGPEDPLDPRQRRRRGATRPSRATCCSATWTPGCIWNLTGGTDGGLHITDVDERQPHDADGPQDARLGRRDRWTRSASRAAMLPEIKPSSEVYGEVRSGGALQRRADRRRPRRPAGGHVRADLLLARRGQEHLRHGQLPAAQHGHGGGAVQERPADHGRLQDRRPGRRLLPRGLDRHHRRARAVAARQPQDDQGGARGRGAGRSSVDDNGGCYFVPAFSGLFAPYWKSNARGVVAGLTRYVNAGHIARATLEATAFQSREVVEAMNQDSGVDARVAQGRRRHGRQRPAHAVPGRPARRAGDPARRSPRRRRSAPPTRPASPPGFWSTRSRTCARTGSRTSAGSRRWTRRKRDEYYKYWKQAVTRTFDWFDADEG